MDASVRKLKPPLPADRLAKLRRRRGMMAMGAMTLNNNRQYTEVDFNVKS